MNEQRLQMVRAAASASYRLIVLRCEISHLPSIVHHKHELYGRAGKNRQLVSYGSSQLWPCVLRRAALDKKSRGTGDRSPPLHLSCAAADILMSLGSTDLCNFKDLSRAQLVQQQKQTINNNNNKPSEWPKAPSSELIKFQKLLKLLLAYTGQHISMAQLPNVPDHTL